MFLPCPPPPCSDHGASHPPFRLVREKKNWHRPPAAMMKIPEFRVSFPVLKSHVQPFPRSEFDRRMDPLMNLPPSDRNQGPKAQTKKLVLAFFFFSLTSNLKFLGNWKSYIKIRNIICSTKQQLSSSRKKSSGVNRSLLDNFFF